MVDESTIKNEYKNYVRVHGTEPSTIYHFCELLGIKESEIYSFFGSFKSIERSIFQDFVLHAQHKVSTSVEYQSASARGKMINFFLELFREMKEERSFVIRSLKCAGSLGPCGVLMNRSALGGFRTLFRNQVKDILNEGKEKGEVVTRPIVGNVYGELFWKHFLGILLFWCSDESTSFARTEELIHKTVSLSFDLLGRGISCGAYDIVRFFVRPFECGVSSSSASNSA
jgi:Tetracyclin repressor-like, C-terminal domain